MGCNQSADLQAKIKKAEADLTRERVEKIRHEQALSNVQAEKDRILEVQRSASEKIQQLEQKLATLQEALNSAEKAERRSSSSSNS